MKSIVGTLNKERPARPYVHKSFDNFLKEHGISKIAHPPYSPYLTPSDFWLFSYIKDRLDSHSNERSLHNQITKIVKEIDRKEWLKMFDKWIGRMEACIKFKGEYFEHFVTFGKLIYTI